VVDEKLDAQTFLYSGGDERNRVVGKPPIAPGVPAALGGDPLKIEPVVLPPVASYPGLKSFIQHEELGKRQAALAAAEADLGKARTALPATKMAAPDASRQKHPAAPKSMEAAQLAVRAAEAKVAAARAELESVQARIAADMVRYGQAPGSADALSRAASRAERQASLTAARATLTTHEHAVAAAEARPATDPQRAATLKAATAQVVAARAAVTRAEAALKQESAAYTPLSPTYPNRSTGRRKALAAWIASKSNPLTARVAVNHLWAWHFGRPLVETTFNFGRSGKPPSHPELLDWLAVRLMDDGWRMKDLHRLLVTSNAYRMSSRLGGPDPRNRSIDPDNRLLWHFPVQRMEAEVVRDSILAAAGTLETRLSGPEIPQEQGLSSHRRSLYFDHHGESRMVFLELFDEANPCDCYRRTASILPQQALALSNSELIQHEGRTLAHGLAAQPDAAFVQAAFEQVLGRAPTAAEQAAAVGFLDRQAARFHNTAPPASGAEKRVRDPALRARENLVIALFNHNDFVTIR
jgi:hypothetical protein